ncbi:protein CREG1-like [Saccoglossus kowalevskii]
MLNVLALFTVIAVCSGKVQNVNRPPYKDIAARARYVVHRADWAVVNTISTQPRMTGLAFSNTNALADGLPDNSTGVPYFYVSPLDVSIQDIVTNNSVTVSFSEAEFNDIEDCIITSGGDPESPLCTRLVLIGKMVSVIEQSERDFAKKALFTRHPLMPTWPESHNWEFMKLDIKDLWIIDFFGGGKHIPVEDYFNANPGYN